MAKLSRSALIMILLGSVRSTMTPAQTLKISLGRKFKADTNPKKAFEPISRAIQ